MMDDLAQFQELVRRVRAGEPEAATILVKRYEQAVRVAIRVKLTDPRLRRQLDAADICQSVMASFFLRAAVGDFDLQNPAALVGLLAQMARNKLYMQARHHRQQRRDIARVVEGTDHMPAIADGEAGPATLVINRDFLSQALAQLPADERRMAELRLEGRSWPEIGGMMGGNAQALRVRFSRAIDRLTVELGLEESP